MDKKVIFQRLGILLAYPLAYAYIWNAFNTTSSAMFHPIHGTDHFIINVAYPLISLLFILVNELVKRGRRDNGASISGETLFWYVMTFLTALSACFGPSVGVSVLAIHLCAVYSVLVSNKVLLGGKTSGFILCDLIDGFYVKSFAGFPKYITDWAVFKRTEKDSSDDQGKRRNHIIPVLFIFTMIFLLIISVSLMASIDPDISLFFDEITNAVTDWFYDFSVPEVFVRCIFAVPVCFYLYGLFSRTASSDGSAEKRVASWISRILDKGKTVSSKIVYVAAGIFVVAYLLFFIKRLAYMLGGFTGTVPEGTLVSHYAREGFFELVGIMAVNMCVYLAIILFGKSGTGGRFTLPARILVTILMAELSLQQTSAEPRQHTSTMNTTELS